MVVVAKPTVKRVGGVAPVMQGPIDDTGEEPFCPCRRIWQNCPCHDNFGAEAISPFRLDAMSAAYAVRRPDKGSTANALVTQVWEFIPKVGQFTVK